MSFGVVSLSTAPVRKSYATRHDCGRYGILTVPQIAKVAGITTVSVYERIRTGRRGESLCVPKRSADKRKVDEPCRLPTVAIAVRLALAFPDRAPTTKQIQAVRPMSRSSAIRWRQAFRDVLEEAA